MERFHQRRIEDGEHGRHEALAVGLLSSRVDSSGERPPACYVGNVAESDVRREGVQELDALTAHKALVRRLIDEVMNAGRLDVLEELYAPAMARAARRWIAPFRASFPDMRMEIVELVAEGETVVGRFRCSGTHLGEWLGHAPTGRRFERVDEVYFFRVRDGRIARAWGLEDTLSRLEQLRLH